MIRTLLPLVLLSLAPAQDAPELLHRDVRVVDLTGSPHERGLEHGRVLRKEVRDMVALFMKDLERTQGVAADVFLEKFLETTDFMPAIEKHTPGLLDEVRGIAEGAGLPFEQVYLFQLADEIWSMGRWALRDKCTAIGVDRRGDQPTFVAQNMDIPGFYQKYPTLLRIRREKGPDTMVLTAPGLIGVNGMNSKSVAIACNTLLQLAPSTKGVPCLFVVRGALERSTLEEAEAWLKQIPHAVGQNYTLGDPSGARAFECSANAKHRFSPEPDGDFTYHTNHPLVSTDWHPDYLARCERRKRSPKKGLRTCYRIKALEERIVAEKPITREVIVDALASRDHSKGPIAGRWTYACTVFELSSKPILHMAPGRADRYAFQKFGF